MQTGPQKKTELHELAASLRELGEFYYWPNEGNLGDLLIAEATRQFFEREKLNWKPFCPMNPPQEASYNLVYGGGGRFTSHWGSLTRHRKYLTAPQVKQCIILPHSFYQVDDFLRSFDNRHTIICRGQHTYDYVTATVAPQVQVALADDMALSLNLATMATCGTSIAGYEAEEKQLSTLLNSHVGRIMQRKVRLSTVRSTLNSKCCKIAFLLRTDAEKSHPLTSPMAYDISLVWSSSCAGNSHTPRLIKLFADALRYPDVVVTDRLHVGILSLLCGKTVYLLDNDYGKLGEVHRLSLQKKYPTAQLITGQHLPPDIEKAFDKLNNSIFTRLYLALRKLRKRV